MAKVKKILIACGSGVVTSTIARKKVEELLDSHGYKGKYEIAQVPMTAVVDKSKHADFVVATAVSPKDLHCPYVDGKPYLMGRGEDEPSEKILKLMKK